MRYEKGTFITVPNKVQMRSLTLGARAVFIEMCEMSDDNGVCFPSRKLLGERIMMSQDSVDRFIEELLAAGFITKTHRKGEKGNYTSNLYQIMILEGVAAPMPPPSRTDTATPSRTHAHLTVSNRTESKEGPSLRSGISFEEVPENPKPPKKPRDTENEKIARWWYRRCQEDFGVAPSAPLTKAMRIIGDARKKLTNAQLKEMMVDHIEDSSLEEYDRMQITQALSAYKIDKYISSI